VKFARARQFVEVVAAHDLEAAEELLDRAVETVTPRGEGDVIARTHEIARWRETGEVAYERDFGAALDPRRRTNRQGRGNARGRAPLAGQ
jgi:hypothetical protein